MNTYLSGYLASIPKYDYDKVIAFLKEIMTVYLPEIDLQAVLNSISNQQAPVSTNITLKDTDRADDSHDKAFSKVYIDLVYLYKIVDLLYAAVNNYTDLSSSYITEIDKEIEKIYLTLGEIERRETYALNTVLYMEEWASKTTITDSSLEVNKALYTDRDGSFIPQCDLLSTNNRNYLSLKKGEYNIDLLRNTDGEIRSKIIVVDYCGVPKTDDYKNALDNSRYTFWDTSVWSRAPIYLNIDGKEITGGYIKFIISLPKIYDITNIEITPYGVDPIEMKAYINESLILNETSSDSVFVYINKKSSDEIIIELMQENYIFKPVTINKKELEAIELWDTKLEDGEVYQKFINDYAVEMNKLVRAWESKNGY